jgi:hypothetical protein
MKFELNGILSKYSLKKICIDIQELIASTDVNFVSSAYNIKGKGDNFNIQYSK